VAIEELEPFVGEWKVEAGFPGSEDVEASCVFEWILEGAFLLQRTAIDYAPAPDSHSIISANPDGGGFTQHYFDSRGVVRVYAMTFEGGRWTLLRDKPDFTPLAFSQRYTGELSDDGSRIDGRWEMKKPGEDWRVDFTLNYVRR
jgi:hypothetical protein